MPRRFGAGYVAVLAKLSYRARMARSRSVLVYGSRSLGVRLHEWHSGMGDPIYAVGSMFVAGEGSPLEDVEAALESLERMHSQRKRLKLKPDAVRSLNSVIADLHDEMWSAKDESGMGYRNNPRRALPPRTSSGRFKAGSPAKRRAREARRAQIGALFSEGRHAEAMRMIRGR